jgi:hypothetical protein
MVSPWLFYLYKWLVVVSTPLKNDRVSSSVGILDGNSQLFLESHENSMVPVTTNQMTMVEI